MIIQTSAYRIPRLLALAFGALLLLPSGVRAAGTAAGTSIVSQSTVVFDLGAITGLTASSTSTFVVDRKIDLSVSAVDSSYVSVIPGAAAQVLTFSVDNLGNDVQDFALSFSHGTDPFGGADNFDAAPVQIFVENGVTAGYQAGQDTATFIDELAPDQSRTVYLVSDISILQANGDISALTLIATAKEGGTAGPIIGLDLSPSLGADLPLSLDTVFADPAGDVDGPRDAVHSDTSAYRVASVNLSVLKSATVFDPYGGNRAQTGAVIRYTLSVTVSGIAPASSVVITDPIPPNTTYRPGTLRLNGGLLSDSADADRGDVGDTAANTVTVSVGDLTSVSPAQTITFEVSID